MDNENTNVGGTDSMKVEYTTTLGDLIVAISEAAEEAAVDDQDLALVTHMILGKLLDR